MSTIKLIPVAVILGVVVAGLFLWAGGDPHEFSGTVYTDTEPAPEFTLTADDGQRHSLDEYRGKVVLMYFGYTFCPDVCPTSLAELAVAVASLDPSDREQVQVIMVSVDPARDTPEVLDQYMAHFDPAFVGFTGTDEEVASVAADYNVFYQVQEGTPATGYLVDHWSGVYLIDGEGNLVESFSYGTPGEMIASDVAEWL
jgi:protein SCO1/2